MRETLERLSGEHQFYHARSSEYASTDNLAFRISPEPLVLDKNQGKAVLSIGEEISSFMAATDELYKKDDSVRELLDRGKPDIFTAQRQAQYLFYRPDLIITPTGFTLCEIETSIFGLGLSELLNRGYIAAGQETMAGPEVLKDFISNHTEPKGTIVYTNKTSAFAGQLGYVADNLFSGDERDWSASHISTAGAPAAMYRAHYLSEYLTDPDAKVLYDSTSEGRVSIPSLTPHMEEKAVMSFIWDSRHEPFYKSALGLAGFNFLRTVIPPTWIVGEEKHFSPGLPHGFESSADLARLTKSQRQFVLKASGFSSTSSWAEGVIFLQSQSQAKTEKALADSAAASGQLFIVQQFQEGVKIPMSYETPKGEATMQARVRLTPYFAADTGKLLTIKATGCEGTQRIHATSSSINTPVLVK
jgi:hypothetical protein